MSLMDDLKAAVAPGNRFPRANFDDIFEKWDKKYREQGLLPTGYETLEYETGRMENRQTKTIQVPIYKEAQQAATDQYIEDEIAAGRLKRVEDEDKIDVPEAKIYKGDYVSKFAEGGEGYVNPYQSPLEAQKNIPPSSSVPYSGPGGMFGAAIAGINSLITSGLLQPGGAGTTSSTGGLLGGIAAGLGGLSAAGTAGPLSTKFDGQNVLQGFADLKSTPIPELQINPSVTAPVTGALPVNTTYNNSAAIANILGGVGGAKPLVMGTNFPAINKPPEATQTVTIPGTEYQSKYDQDLAAQLIAEYKANKAKQAPPTPTPTQTSSSGYNFGLPSIGVMGTPDAPPALAAQPSPTTETRTSSQSDGLTPQQKQFMQTVRGLQESEMQRVAAERVTRQNMARAGQTADIRLGIQNGQTASGVDAFKRRFKIGQQSPSTNLMINA